MEDQHIIELFLQRNKNAVVQTEMKYTNYCRTIATNLLHCREDADEALNDTWLAAWNSIPPHTPMRLQTFLGKITRNICLKRIRSDNAQKRGTSESRVIFDEIEEWLSSEQNVENEISEKLLAETINEFLGNISDTERNVFVRRYWYMQSVSEIASCHGFSESKVKSMLFRIRKKLYTKLKKENFL